ncbi:hypothetical protein R1sor_009940 [Riccia sorocarpa]|uniref:Reverse transcriptase n=1 Tax=Riccia sorocarpa TaxID=122646 RepID=A0ABD3HZX9_9MARC
MGDSLKGRLWSIIGDRSDRIRQVGRSPTAHTIPGAVAADGGARRIGIPASQQGESGKKRGQLQMDIAPPVRKELFADQQEDAVNTDVPDLNNVDFPPLNGAINSQEPLTSSNPSTSSETNTLGGSPIKSNAWTTLTLLNLNRARKDENPYMQQVDPSWGKGIPDEDIKDVLEEVCRINPPGNLDGAKRIQWTSEDTETTKVRLDQLRKASIIISTPESTPTRDDVEGWLERSLVLRLRLTIVQLRVLSRQLFLLVVRCQEERDRVLNSSSLTLDGFPVNVFPWTVDFNPRKENVKRVATWVELPAIDPLLEHLGTRMLVELGHPTYKTVTRGVNWYTNMRGCVMMDEGADHPSKLVFDLPWGGIAVQDIKYQTIPNACFKCRRAGHQARECTYQAPVQERQPSAAPARQQMDPTTPTEARDDAQKTGIQTVDEVTDPFTEVRKRKGKSHLVEQQDEVLGTPTKNPYTALLSQEVEDEDMKMTDELQADADLIVPGHAVNAAEDQGTPSDLHMSGTNLENEGLDPPITPSSVHGNGQLPITDSQEARSPTESPAREEEPSLRQAGERLDGNLTNLGSWADAAEAEMHDIGSRGVKGRLPVDEQHTPDRGNVQKKRLSARSTMSPVDRVLQLSLHQEISTAPPQVGEPRPLSMTPQDVSLGIGENQSWGSNIPNASVDGILNAAENWALGPTEYVDRLPEQIGELFPEMLTNGPTLDKSLQRVMPGGQSVVDYKQNGIVDSVLLIHKNFPILERGASGHGFGVWAKIRSQAGVLGIVGIHGPRERCDRPAAWKWLRELTQEGKWVIIGDFNMVESRVDTIGPSPLMRGAELRKWTMCSNQADLVDTWLVANVSKGPWFTRQAVHGSRFDQSRIDRCYISELGEWVYRIAQEEHYGTCSLSDHIPISVQLQLIHEGPTHRKPTSYFKMNARYMQSQEFRQRIKETWSKHPDWAQDPRKKWSLALGRIRLIFKDHRDCQERELPEMVLLQERLARAREAIQTQQSDGSQREFETALQLIRQREKADAYICRVRCRIRWFREGDAATHFFFARYKAKMSQERLTTLKTDSGQIITDEDSIFRMIQATFSELYKEEPEDEGIQGMREELLQLTDKKMSVAQNQALEETPSTELIEELVKSLPKEKAPGFDGVVAEVVVDGWEFMGPDCIEMITWFWKKRKLLAKDNRGVIKLIPKEGDLLLLKSWRPITLLTITYKVIARIIAHRMKRMLPELIDSQQSGFVAGRNIVDNVLSLRFAQEWALTTGQEVIFVKLDFQKAYDRVAHNYLWSTLQALGMSDSNIRRIQGLVLSGSASIHVNGKFTADLQVQRGVRQGCPLAPLLFAISTQPLMRLLREEEKSQRILGLNAEGDRTILHQLYADDTGINVTINEQHFNRLQEVIHIFERCSGAKLNLSKSLIMPLAPCVLPSWVEDTGCKIATPGVHFKYLGVLTGCPVDEGAIKQAVIKRIQDKLTHWSNHMLSWPARTLLLNHVLAATPLYQMLSVGLNSEGIDGLERLCRCFLWGWNEQGNAKKALVTWERVSQPKANGGLGWTPIKDRAKALHIKVIIRLLQGADTEWAQLARNFILRTLRNGRYQRERRQWTTQEGLLLDVPSKVVGSPTLTRMLRSWKAIHTKIQWDETNGVLKGGLTQVGEAMEAAHSEGGWTRLLQEKGFFPEQDDVETLQSLEQWIKARSAQADDSDLTKGWKWKASGEKWKASGEKVEWGQTTSFWTKKVALTQNFDGILNGRLGITMITVNWSWRWKKLWGAPISYKRKVWIWKFLQRGFFMGSRAADMGIADGLCRRCQGQVETLEHCFWVCRGTRTRKGNLMAIGALPGQGGNILACLDLALGSAKRDPAHLTIFGNFLDLTWKERNDRVFRHKITRVPTHQLLANAAIETEAFPTESTGQQAMQAIVAAKTSIERWKCTWNSWTRNVIDTTRVEEATNRDDLAVADVGLNDGGAHSAATFSAPSSDSSDDSHSSEISSSVAP